MVLEAVIKHKLIILTTTTKKSKLHNCFKTLWRAQIIAFFFPPQKKHSREEPPPFFLQVDITLTKVFMLKHILHIF